MWARSKINPPEIVEGGFRLPEAEGSVKPAGDGNGTEATGATEGRPAAPHRIRHWLVGIGVILIALLLSVVVLYRFIQPVSTLMLARMAAGRSVNRQWVPIERISPFLQAAVIMSEDGQFCRHRGVDWNALGEAIHDIERGGLVRGASTISMQAAKNLFLWPSRSYLRKGLEIPLALLTDFGWGKRRMLEIYLNIAQWGGGTFGIETAARHYFNVDAADLTPGQAALLAVALPDPRDRNSAKPGRLQQALAATVLRRLGDAKDHLACLPQAQSAFATAKTSQQPGFGVSARP